VNIETGDDPVADLIRGSTSGGLQSAAASAYGFVTGDATDGMEDIGKLKTIASDLTLQMTGGSLGSQISNSDREFIVERVGNIADPTVPAAQRLAAWEQVKSRMAAVSGIQLPQAGEEGDATSAEQSRGLWGQEVYDEQGNPLGPQGGTGFDAQGNQLGHFAAAPGEDPAVLNEADRLNDITGEYGVADLARHGMSLGLTDEASGIGQIISGALKGDLSLGSIQRNYQLGRDTEQHRIDQARNKLGWGGTVAEVAGGGGLGRITSGIGNALSAGRSVAARGAPVTRGAVQSQMTRSAGIEGATVGGVGGFGYGEGLEGSVTNAALGAVAGGTLAVGGQAIGNTLANRRSPARVAGAEVQQSADDLRIPTIPAVTGGPVSRAVTAGARQGFISDAPIAKAVGAMEDAGGKARSRISSATGQALPDDQAGEVVRKAANVYSRRTSEIGGKLYTRADRMADGEALPLPQAVAKADEWLAKLGKSVDGTEGQLYKDVKSLRDKMAAGKFEIEGIRQTRTALRESLTERGLRGSATDKVFGDILEAATGDMYDGLAAAGKQNAAGALKTANAFWKKRVETIDDVLEPILGKNAPRSGEQIVTALENMANPKTGNGARLRQLFQAMPKGETRSVAATLINRMGQPTKGAAEIVDGTGFSFNTFLTNWNNLSPQARRAAFPPETVDALNKLAVVSRGVKQAGAAANTSNTARAIGVQVAISPLLWWVNPLAAIGGGAAQYSVGKLMASPRFARWLAGAPKTANPAAQRAYVGKLAGIARAEPAIANEIGLFTRAANDNLPKVGNVAASPGEGPDDPDQ
jgi:hypothetical protein